jgi:type IV pilus assembly protein PilV
MSARGAMSQQGSSLVEVMIALFVLAIGLLGVLAMQSKSMQYNQSANTYSQAVYIANDIVERIRNNPDPAARASYETLTLAKGATRAVPAVPCTASDCTPAQIFARDRYAIAQSIDRWLPGGSLVIAKHTGVTGLPGREFLNITVSFDDSKLNEDSQTAATTLNYSLVMEI